MSSPGLQSASIPTQSLYDAAFSPSPPAGADSSNHSMATRVYRAGDAVVGYNPQQWTVNGSPATQFLPHSAIATTSSRPSYPEDGISEPPPPYSRENSTTPSVPTPSQVPHRQSPQPVVHTSHSSHRPAPVTLHSQNMASPASTTRSAPTVPTRNPQGMSFPPPPNAVGTRDRSSSRTGRSRFGLTALARSISADRSAIPSAEVPNGHDGAPVFMPPTRPMPRTTNLAANRMSVHVPSTQPVPGPPAARRSASAGAGPQQSLHLPPPPPGPPPSAPRTATGELHHRNGSIQLGNTLVPVLSMPTRRPPRILPGGTALGPVPPTPADWIETPGPARDELPRAATQIARTQNPSLQSQNHASSVTAPGPKAMESSTKGLRERRSESRQARDRNPISPAGDVVDQNLDSRLAGLTLNLNSAQLNRQGAVKKSRSSMSPQQPPSASANDHTPRTGSRMNTNDSETSTVSARTAEAAPLSAVGTLSQPETSNNSDYQSTEVKLTRQSSAAGKRRAITPEASNNGDAEKFAKASMERHQIFMQQELTARSDRERLELFAEYIVLESRLRRDRYGSAFTDMASDIFDLTRDLWRPLVRQIQEGRLSNSNKHSAVSSDDITSPSVLASTGRQSSIQTDNTNSPMSSRADWTPRSESESPTSLPSTAGRDNGFRQYQPVLSPIPSMAMSTAPDGESRGRSASRWWESDDGSIGAGRQVERTKRESKYMGLGRVARFNLQYEDEPSPAQLSAGYATSTNQYPPEKVGWHEPALPQESLQTPQLPSMPNTPSATTGLDVSRLITLPPPYPRHYPAINNAHPDLENVRTIIRALSDVSFVKKTRETFEQSISHERAVATQESAARIAQARHRISEQVQARQMTYADAAIAEENIHKHEAKETNQLCRKQYARFQPEVHGPVQALLLEQVKKATATIDQLCESMRMNASESGPDAAMEQGDEQPELLEQLKLHKWLVEAREMLNRELFNLESEQCDRYRDVVVADLSARAETAGKKDDALTFFHKDSLDRWCKFEKSARMRLTELMTFVNQQVDRGVQDQLSAFWDIAPGLVEVVKRIPLDTDRLAELNVSIPHAELAENPAYYQHPMQYLYGLLCHAEKATYQFIDNQTGLWCLSNEVSALDMRAGVAIMSAERCLASGSSRNDPDMLSESAEVIAREEDHLNEQLKERVAEVESQWKEALGSDLSAALEKVEWLLRASGGWDDSLQE